MSVNYINNLLLAVVGGFLVVAARVFAPGTAGWLGLAVGIAAVALALTELLVTTIARHPAAAGVTALVGVWTIVSSTVFAGTTLGWLVFADALALVAVGLVELTRHELRTERVVHTLVVDAAPQLV